MCRRRQGPRGGPCPTSRCPEHRPHCGARCAPEDDHSSAFTASNGGAKKPQAPEQPRQAVSTHLPLQRKGPKGPRGSSTHTSLTHSRTHSGGPVHWSLRGPPAALRGSSAAGGEGQAARGARPGSPSCHGCRGSVRTLQVQLTQLCGRGPDAQPLAPESRSPPLSLTSTRTKLQTQRPASECRAQSAARWRVWRRKARGTAPRRQAAAGQGRRSRGRPEFPRGAWLCCP